MHFIITFGFQVFKKFNRKDDQSGDETQVTTKKEKRQNSRKKSKDTSETSYSPNIINVGDVLAEIHVEYEFFSGYTFKFDCRCWETATKIYTENGDYNLRPVLCPIKENVIWVVFSIHHLLQLNETQLQHFFNHVITYRIFCGKKKFSTRASKDKVKKFYIHENSIGVDPYDFLELYTADPNIPNRFSTKSIISYLPEPTTITDEVYGDLSVITYLDVIPDRAHEYRFRKMSRKDRFPSEFLDVELIKNAESGSKLAKKKRSNVEKSSKKETEYEINLPAETIFSDMGTNTSFKRTAESPNVSSVLIYTECRDILSNKQVRMNLNPIAIKLEQLSNFPANLIIESGFKYLYANIFFLNRTIDTSYYIPSRTIYFEFIKCFLYKEFNPEELINSLTTKPIIVKVIGIKNTDVIDPPSPASKKSVKNAAVTAESPETTKDEVLLGVAKYDVSDLLRGIWELRLISSLFHPRNVDFACVNDTNEEEIQIPWENSPLTSDVLSSYGTSVKIKVRLSYDLRKVQYRILRYNDKLNRIFLMLSDITLVKDIMKNVSSYNSNVLKTYQLPDLDSEDNDLKPQVPKDILTGFCIDCSEKFYIFLEGLSNGYLLKIWKMVANLCFETKSVYYNSSYIFLTRLYEDFVPFGGIVYIKLGDPLEIKLRKCSLYIGETKTTVEANLLKKMGLMKLTSTITSLCQSCLFPESSVVKDFLDNIHQIRIEYSQQFITN